MARDRGVGMTADEVAELLDNQQTITLATIGPDGMPHLAAMWFARDGEDLLLWTYGSSQKTRNMERDPRASVLAEAGAAYNELRGASLECDVEIVRDPDEVLKMGQALLARHSASGAPGEDVLRAQAAKRVGLRLRPVRTRSWDHRKLGAAR